MVVIWLKLRVLRKVIGATIKIMIFQDRMDAGKKLADKVFSKYGLLRESMEAVVLVLPRGGVPVGYEIAQKLKIPLDLIVTHKLGAPGNEELAIGAVSEDGSVFLDPEFSYQITDQYVKKEIKHQLAEIQKRVEKYRNGRPLPDLKGKIIFLVDDGIATGNTMQAAIRTAKKAGAGKIIVATPVLPSDTSEKLKTQCDDVIFLAAPKPFWAIGRFYLQFEQLDDETVKNYLV